ncbi:MAG: hypothetical protein PHT12_04810 [Patescibacteria group bacterium]|nr:hypothetical protein [Patescibacteria group bacterium]
MAEILDAGSFLVDFDSTSWATIDPKRYAYADPRLDAAHLKSPQSGRRIVTFKYVIIRSRTNARLAVDTIWYNRLQLVDWPEAETFFSLARFRPGSLREEPVTAFIPKHHGCGSWAFISALDCGLVLVSDTSSVRVFDGPRRYLAKLA